MAKITGCYLDYTEVNKGHLRIVASARSDGEAWIRLMTSMGEAFDVNDLPETIRMSWRKVVETLRDYSGSHEILASDEALAAAVLYLISASDSACAGLGVTDQGAFTGEFGLMSNAKLAKDGTLCLILGLRYGRVLPKMHTPKVGLNLRNLTRHVCYCDESEVSVGWNIREAAFSNGHASFNLMVVPWPFEVSSTSITSSQRKSSTKGVGYFEYSPDESKAVVNEVADLVRSSKRSGNRVDMVVLPECAISESSWAMLSSKLIKDGVSVLAGVYGKSSDGQFINSVRFRSRGIFDDEVVQHKHHRWKLDESQICGYSLGGTLGCDKEWWENIRIRDRRVNFFSFNEGFVFCPLICEDLARQDPVSDIVRSVGPNLVIALLMDGPQLPHRWSSRYASVLADDPGSSVLTVSSLGMVELSAPPPGVVARRVVASWKQAGGSFTEICLEGGAKAALLNLQSKKDYEQAVDGIPVDFHSSIPVLTGVHYVK